MKKIFISLLLLLLLLTTSTHADTVYKYAGPFYMDAIKSSQGVLGLSVTYGVSTVIIIGGDDEIQNWDRSCNDSKLDRTTTSKDNKTIIFKSKLKYEDGICVLNILTKNNLTHSLSLYSTGSELKSQNL